VEEEHESWIA